MSQGFLFWAAECAAKSKWAKFKIKVMGQAKEKDWAFSFSFIGELGRIFLYERGPNVGLNSTGLAQMLKLE